MPLIYQSKNNKIYLEPLFKLLIWVLMGIFVFVTGQEVPHNPPLTKYLNLFFFKGVLHKGFLSLFEIAVIIICIGIFYYLKPRIKKGMIKEKILFYSSIIAFVFLMINPNNDPATFSVFGMPLFTRLQYYTYFILLFCFLFIRKEFMLIIVRNIGEAFVTLVIIRSTLLLLFFAQGRGTVFLFDVKSALVEEDTLIHFVLAQLLIGVQFGITKKKKYLVFWLLIFLVELFSFRRSGFLLMLLSHFILIGLYFLKGSNANTKIRLMFSVILIITIYIFVFPQIGMDLSQHHYYQRYFGAFLPDKTETDFERNEHIEQSNYGFDEAKNKIGFWGNGIASKKKETTINYRGNTGIHNAYVMAWIEYGLINFLFYALLFFLALNELFLFIKEKNSNKTYLLLKGALIVFTILFYVNAWVLILQNFININMLFVRVILFATIFKLNPSNYYYLLNRISFSANSSS